MKIGAIDIGTNSMRLLIADYINGSLLNREKYVNTTRIGQGVDKQGYIVDEAISRNVNALKEFLDICNKKGCEHVFAMGTSALRDSKNTDEFIRIVKDKTGIDLEIISGLEESNLGFLGVLEGLEEDNKIFVIDIGGGSTEFIIGDKDGIEFAKSENIGALRMTEKFLKDEQINNIEFDNMKNFIKEEIKTTLSIIKQKNVKKLVGIGGTITSLSAINQKLEIYSMQKIHNSKLSQKEVEKILQNLINMTLSDKKQLKGLQPKRADIITAGVEILNIIMKELRINEIIVSEYDNLEGLICQKLRKMS